MSNTDFNAKAKAIPAHSSLHEYDVNKLRGEIAFMMEAAELLESTEVPQYLHAILTEQINRVGNRLRYGHPSYETE